MNFNQDYEWVLKCIESCQNTWQLETCEVLINLFIKKHGEYIEARELFEKIATKISLITII